MAGGVLVGAAWYDMYFICWVLALSAVPDYLYKMYGLWRHFTPVFATQVAAALVVTIAIALCTWLT